MDRSLTSKSIFIFCIVVAFSSPVIEAQQTAHTIKVLSHVKADRVWLRWAPTDFTVWQLGNKYGYKVERFALNPNGTLSSPAPVVLHAAVKPFSKTQLETLAKATQEAVIIEELIYGENETFDSNSPAAILKKNDDLNNRFGMLLLACDLAPAAAHAAGLFLSDSTAMQNSRYIYKVTIADASAKIKVEPGVIFVDVVEAKPLRPFTDLAATFGDRTVTLTWPTLLHKGIYTAYNVEKYDEKKNEFKLITDLPYIPMSPAAHTEEVHFVDSLADNTTTVQYRVKGITPFGEVGPASNVVKGMGIDDIAKYTLVTRAKLDKNKIDVQWEFSPAFENKIGGFVVGRAGKAGGPFKPIHTEILSPKTRKFSDAIPNHSMYYQVNLVDTKGNVLSHSFPYFVHIEDNVAPAVPVGLIGKIDSTGIVTLTWKENTDEDLLGYRLFSSNDIKHEFVEVTREIATATTFSDTINIHVLNKDIFYNIVSVDQNYNTSNYSAPIKLKRPDVIKPISPVFLKAEPGKTDITLSWIASNSDDVARHVLYRKGSNDVRAKEIFSWPTTQAKTSYADNSVIQGNTYRYILEAHDSAGNVNRATSKEIRFESGFRAAVTDLVATINREDKTITLRWKYEEPAVTFNLYRRKDDEPFTLYQSRPAVNKEFVDSQVMINNTYSYKIQLILGKKIKTELSKELKVPF